MPARQSDGAMSPRKGTISGNWETWAGQFGRGYLLEQIAAAIEILAKRHQDAAAEVEAADARRYKRRAVRQTSDVTPDLRHVSLAATSRGEST